MTPLPCHLFPTLCAWRPQVMQMQPSSGFFGCVRYINSNHGGFRGFFRGWTPLYIKLAPHTVVVFVAMEQLRSILGL